MRRSVRETAFRLARRDLASFLEEHQEELVQVFREELGRLDDEIPEENLFIDIKMVPLGEMMLRAVIQAMVRFLTENTATISIPESTANVEPEDDATLQRASNPTP